MKGRMGVRTILLEISLLTKIKTKRGEGNIFIPRNYIPSTLVQ